MSMRLSHEERQTLWSALYDYLKNISGENPDEEKRARRLRTRLENFDITSLHNATGGYVTQGKKARELQSVKGVLQGYTGKTYEELMRITSSEAEAKA